MKRMRIRNPGLDVHRLDLEKDNLEENSLDKHRLGKVVLYS